MPFVTLQLRPDTGFNDKVQLLQVKHLWFKNYPLVRVKNKKKFLTVNLILFLGCNLLL